jgi:hypothetical protein
MKSSDEKYSRIGWEPVRKMYAKPMMRVMTALYTELTADAPEVHASEPWVMDCDSYSVCITLAPEGLKERIDLSLEIADSRDFEGIEGGYTFKFDIVAEGGRMLGGCAPYNYTKDCWCKTHAAIKERFALLESAVADAAEAVVDAVKDYMAESD